LPTLPFMACHEAGHAAAHIWLTLPFQYVTIESPNTGGVRGYTMRQRSSREIERGWTALAVHREMMAFLVGPLAAATYVEHCQVSAPVAKAFLAEGAASDLEYVDALARLLCGTEGQVEARVAKAMSGADMLLSEPGHWPSVKAVTEALLERSWLTAWQVRKIVREAVNGKGKV